MKLAIYGAGGFGLVVYDIAVRQNNISPQWDDIFFVTDVTPSNKNLPAKYIYFDEMLAIQNDVESIVAIGEPSHRELMYTKLQDNNIKIATLIDPSAIISPTATIAEGAIVCELVAIHANAHIGVNCSIQPYSIIGHDVTVGKHCSFSAAFISGGTSIFGDRVFAGINSCTKEKLVIGNDVVLAMGATIFSSAPDGTTFVGNPARPSKPNLQGKVFK